MRYTSIIGYVVKRDTKERVYDGGLWMVYESDDLEAVKADFEAVANDLLPQYGDDVEFEIDLIQPLDKPPKMWKNRVVQKLD